MPSVLFRVETCFWEWREKKITGSMHLFYKHPESKLKWGTVRVILLLTPFLLP